MRICLLGNLSVRAGQKLPEDNEGREMHKTNAVLKHFLKFGRYWGVQDIMM